LIVGFGVEARFFDNHWSLIRFGADRDGGVGVFSFAGCPAPGDALGGGGGSTVRGGAGVDLVGVVEAGFFCSGCGLGLGFGLELPPLDFVASAGGRTGRFWGWTCSSRALRKRRLISSLSP
jgi:hypothetical protein